MLQLDTEVPVCPHCKSRIPYVPLHQEDLQPGTRLGEDGRFIIGRALGHGGYGITYIAYDTKMDVRRTIKEYFPKGASRNYKLEPVYPESEAANVERTREHFLHEARMMIRASEGHIPGIVQGIDQFQENGTSYILMEYLEGYTLDDYMHNVLYGPFQWDAAVHYVVEALDALQKLHEKNIIHRDISCNNIFLCTDNTIRLIDFGSAEPLDKAQTDPGSLWRSRKPAYTPREQAENREQGAYSDIYAMGVVLFKMITGNVDRQLNGRTLPSVRAAANNQEIPAALDKILMEATAEDPASRIQTAAEFRRKLLPLIGEKDGKGRRGVLLGALAILLTALILGIVLIFFSGRPEDSWAEITLSQAEREVRIDYGGSYGLSGTSQPNENVRLIVRVAGGEQQFESEETSADSQGNWQIEFDTSGLPVEKNRSAKFETFVEYGAQDHRRSSDYVDLIVSREFAPLTLGYADWAGTYQSVEWGETITLKGTGQSGEKVRIFSAEEGIDQETVCEADGWLLTIDTSEIAFAKGEAEKTYHISAGYNSEYAIGSGTGSRDELTLKVTRQFKPITISFEDGSTSLTIREADLGTIIRGTAEPGETLSLMIGTDIYSAEAGEDGQWEYEISAIRGISGYVTNSEVPFDIYARYNAKTALQSEHLTLISNVQVGKTDHTPIIATVSPITVTEGNEIVLEGTADAGATMTLRVFSERDSQSRNLTSGITATADQEDGSWKLSLNTGDIAEERKEGSSTGYTARMELQFGGKEYQSNPVTIFISKPKTYSIPTIRFEEGTERSLALRYTEAVTLTGTARSGEHLRILINDQEQPNDIVVRSDGTWSYRINSLETWKPELEKTTELSLQVRYIAVDVTSKTPLRLSVTNPRLTPLTVQMITSHATAGGDADRTIGLQGTATISVIGSAGQELELLRNNVVWKTVRLDEAGAATVQLTAEDIPSGSVQAELQFRYIQQSENTSDPVVLRVDRIADAIRITGELTEESASIGGTAEAGAEIVLFINNEPVASVTAKGDGSFLFDHLQLTAGDAVSVSETDPYGNSTTWNDQVKAVTRENIQLSEYENNRTILYGPESAALTLSGTASRNKLLTATIRESGSFEDQVLQIPVGEDGKWETMIALPVSDQKQTDILIQYEDSRGNNLILHTWCDASVEQPDLQPEILYEHSPDELSCRLTESDCTIHWALISESGQIKAEKTLAGVSGTVTMIELPAGRAAGDQFVVTVTDPYGNQSVRSIQVQEQRDEISGTIQSAVDVSENEVHDGDSFSGTLQIQAYAAAGIEASADSASVQLVQNDIIVARVNLSPVTGNDLQWVADKLSGHQADKGWRLKKGTLDISMAEEGPCTLRLVVGSKVVESWSLTYSGEDTSAGTVMHVEDSGDGYDMGMDAPSLSYSPKAICLSGWLYNYYDDTTRAIGSGRLTLYEEQACVNAAAAASSSRKEFRKRLPGTTSCGTDARNLDAAAYEKGGWIMQFKQVKVEDGTYWAVLEIDGGDITFGPFELKIQNNNAQVKNQKEFIKSLTWATED